MSQISPKVTVGIPVYRGQAYIREAIDSVIKQTYRNWELLIVDDATPDSSVDIIKSISDPRIRLLRNAENLGLVATRNRILSEASGDFLAWLDQDDLASPHRLATQVGFLKINPQISICGSFTHTIQQSEEPPDWSHLETFPKHHNAIRAALPFLNPMACNTIMMRLRDIKKLKFEFRSEMGNSLDYDFWSRVSDLVHLENIGEPLGTYRIHPRQTSRGAELRVMQDQALTVQSELIARALQLPMSESERELHRSATQSPLDIQNADHLGSIANWFARLRKHNKIHEAFDKSAFDEMLSRQFTSCVLSARHHLHFSSLTWETVSGMNRIHPGIRPTFTSILRGLHRRRVQRPRAMHLS